jgi:hypothetical protein
MIDTAGCEGERGLDIVRLKIGQLRHDLGMTQARDRKVEHVDDANTQAPYTGPAAELVRSEVIRSRSELICA